MRTLWQPGELGQLRHARHGLPSSFMISQITPPWRRPASRARSTAASVCPARTSTPPSRARNGKTWPGRTRSPGLLDGSMATRMVWARSAAEMPVVTPSAASMDSVKRGAEARVVARRHGRQLQRVADFGAERKADQAARVPRHEVDDVGRDFFGGDGDVAFVFAIFIVDDDEHPAGPKVFNRFGDGSKGHGVQYQDRDEPELAVRIQNEERRCREFWLLDSASRILSSRPELGVQVGGDARERFGIGQDVANPVARVVVVQRVGGGQRQAISGLRVLRAHARPVLLQVLELRDGVGLGQLAQLLADVAGSVSPESFCAKPSCSQAGQGVEPDGMLVRQACTSSCASARCICRAHLRSVGPGDVNAPVILPAAPFRGAGGAQVSLAALHDGDDALVRSASQLRGDGGIVAIQRCQDGARGIGGQRLAFIAQRHMHAVELVAAMVGIGFALYACVNGRQRLVGRNIQRLLPIIQSAARNWSAAIGGESGQHQNVGIARVPGDGVLDLLQRLRGLIGFEQLLGAIERGVARLGHRFLRFGHHRVERAQHIHRSGRRPLLLVALQSGERGGGNIAQNIFAVDCRGHFEAIRAVRQAEAHFHRCTGGQTGDDSVARNRSRSARAFDPCEPPSPRQKRAAGAPSDQPTSMLWLFGRGVARVKTSETCAGVGTRRHGHRQETHSENPAIVRLRHDSYRRRYRGVPGGRGRAEGPTAGWWWMGGMIGISGNQIPPPVLLPAGGSPNSAR